MKIQNVTLNKDGRPRKSGSGRRKGSKSLMEVELGHLMAYMDQSSMIMIGRKWYEENFKKFVAHKALRIESGHKNNTSLLF